MQLPPRLRERMKGRPLAAADAVSAVGGDLSVLGVKTLVLTDRPGVYLHDAGGILAGERLCSLEKLVHPHVQLAFEERSRVLRGLVEFPDGPRVAVEFRKGLAKVADALIDRLARTQADLLFETPLPVSVSCDFSESKEAIRRQAAAADPALARQLAGDGPPSDGPWTGVELHAVVEVRGNRLRLRKREQALADFPLDRVQATQPGPSDVLLRGEVMVAGVPATALTVHLPSKALAGRLRKALGGGAGAVVPAGAPERGLVETVQVRGRLAEGQPLDRRLDAIVTDEAVELRDTDCGRTLCRFAFADPSVSVAGTARRFVLAGEGAGPLVVSGGADRFRERLARNEGLIAAARRTAADGPHPAFLGDDPVVCRAAEDALEIRGAGVARRLDYDLLRDMKRDAAGTQEVLTLGSGREGRAEVRLVGERDVLQGLFADVAARCCARQFAGRPRDLVGAILGLERDYFIYSLFGPLYEVHALLGQHGEEPSATGPVAQPDRVGDRLALASVMAEALEPLRDHLDKVSYYLPSHLAGCDGDLCRPEGPPPRWLKDHERGYRAVLMGVQPVLAEIRVIREFLLRVQGVEERLGRGPDYGAAALSLALGAVVNPMFLVSAAQQAFAASRQSERLKEEQGASAGQSVERALHQWNYLVRELLPGLWHHLLDGLFPLRLQLYDRVQKELEAEGPGGQGVLFTRLARRLGVLATFLQFPAGEASTLTRGAIVAGARRLQEQLSYEGFHHF